MEVNNFPKFIILDLIHCFTCNYIIDENYTLKNILCLAIWADTSNHKIHFLH